MANLRGPRQRIMEIIPVSTPAKALELFKTFRKESGANPITVPGSRAKYYTAQQVVDWYATQNKKINLGWFARALHAAVSSGMRISKVDHKIDGNDIVIYRGS